VAGAWVIAITIPIPATTIVITTIEVQSVNLSGKFFQIPIRTAITTPIPITQHLHEAILLLPATIHHQEVAAAVVAATVVVEVV